jgi:hypothetical protein
MLWRLQVHLTHTHTHIANIVSLVKLVKLIKLVLSLDFSRYALNRNSVYS